MATKLEELNVTPEEMERFTAAFQDRRFLELFTQYVEELQDPENQRRYEQEIREMERQRGLDVQFIQPQPCYVLRTIVNGRNKAFVNVCSSPEIQKPHRAPATSKDGRTGHEWTLPCTLTPARQELDSDNCRVLIYDVVFHPDTLQQASLSDRFRSFLDLTALSTVSREYRVQVDTENFQTVSEKYMGRAQPTFIRKAIPGDSSKPQGVTGAQQCHYYYNAQKSRKTTQPPTAVSNHRPSPLEPTVPHYTIRHRSYLSLQDYRNSRDSAPSPVPQELVITVYLPLLNSGIAINLQIHPKDLSLESYNPAYKLQLTLPYLVEDSRGTAQFNKTTKQLVITLPVVQQDPPSLIPTLPPAKEDSPQSIGTTEDSKKTPPNSLDNPECPIVTCSQDATTVTLLIHVKDIDQHSVTSEVSSYQCEVRFCVKTSYAPCVLFVAFLPQYGLNTNEITVNVSADNMVIELTKSTDNFGPWKSLYYGVNSNTLQESSFINENADESLDNSLPPSTIPWSTQVDAPQLNVLEMTTGRRNHIRMKIPVEEEQFLTDEEQHSGLSGLRSLKSSHSENTSQFDTNETSEESQQTLHPAMGCPTSPLTQPSAQRTHTDRPAEEDEGLCTPAPELDGDDLPDGAELAPNPTPNPSSTDHVLYDVACSDRSALFFSDHRTQCAFKFDNALLFDLD
ncbi:protein kintoun-like [Anomaloglossus baeobatrachus]|uniref:protein kintoun-like n=1 Tax=Anomaloglossus baeobatrachus TaxID=238106 RepID=UPI003F509750